MQKFNFVFDILKKIYLRTVGHFSQVIWADTTQIGCAMSTFFDGSWYSYLVACNYYTAGNYQGQQVYPFGATASACPNGVDATFTGLCI